MISGRPVYYLLQDTLQFSWLHTELSAEMDRLSDVISANIHFHTYANTENSRLNKPCGLSALTTEDEIRSSEVTQCRCNVCLSEATREMKCVWVSAGRARRNKSTFVDLKVAARLKKDAQTCCGGAGLQENDRLLRAHQFYVQGFSFFAFFPL